MSTVSGDLEAKGVSASLALGNQAENLTYTITGTYDGSWQVEEATPSELSWGIVAGPFTANTVGTIQGLPNRRYRVRCTAYTSGTISYTMSDVDADLERRFSPDGVLLYVLRQNSLAYTINVSYDLDVSVGGSLTVGGSLKLTIDYGVPTAEDDPGTAGTVAVDTGYIYICTATDTWKRVAIATWP